MAESQERNPYVGPRPFERQDRDLFFGRDRETSEVLSLVIAHRVLLLYAQSGAGKTSLLNAGLIPLLEKEGFEVLPLTRVRGLIPKDVEPEEIPNLYIFNTLMSWAEDEADPRRLAQISLAGFLKEREHPTDAEGLPSPRVVIFDQFEELFAFYQERWRDREGFFKQALDALGEDPLLRVVFVIREDYIAQLDPFAPLLPEKLRTRFRLERLRKGSALSAITGPLGGARRSFAEGVAEQLVEDLLKVRVETATGKTEVVTGEFVEPVQLQVVCQSLWRDLPPDVTVITRDHLKAFGDVNQALSEFYEISVKSASEESGVTEEDLREWFEEILITSTETRGTVHRGREETGGIPNAAVDVFEDLHLIRGEWRAGARWYELTHDRFIEPILDSNEAWIARPLPLGRYDDFELLVMKKDAEGYPTRVISASAGEAQGILSLDSASDDIQRALARIETGKTDEELFINFGRTLFQRLFSDEIEDIYRVSLEYARARGRKGLRIKLRLEPPELGVIPWEYLYDELNNLFLGVSPKTPLIRYIQVPNPPLPITIHLALKVLAVISNPVNLAEYGLPELDAEKEKQVLSQALEEWEKDGLVQLEFLDHAIASEIREKLRRYQPHIVHFIGHGAFKDDKAYLVIEDDERRFRLINDRTFREFFLGSDSTKLVVLNACQSAASSSTQPMVGLAPNLVRRGLPAVVAMQYSLYDDTAIKFSREFYRALAVGFPVDTAISEARRGIYIDCGAETRDWGIPVLFMRSPDGVLLKLTKPIARSLRLESIPGSGNFIGRKRELEEYQRRLDSQNIVVIGGTAGVGKTMLGAQIVAQQSQRRVFWHTFHRGLNDNLESVLWALGGFLAASEDDALQRFLDLNIEKLEEGYQLSEAINLLIHSLEQGFYLLCFDDFQVADENEKINSLFEIFNARLQETKVMVMSRRSPRFADAIGLDYEPLAGLSKEDAEALLNRGAIHLSAELFSKLYDQTLGNPMLLELFITWMKDKKRESDEVSELIDRAFGERVEDYLIRSVYETLSAEEQRLLKAISIFRAPVDEEAIVEVLEEDMENVDRLLDALVNKYAVQESDYGEKYLHSLLAEFCHDRLRTDVSLRLHKNAGRYYYSQEDYLEAAHHYFEAREYQKSAETIIENLEQLIYAGQSSAIMGQLRKLGPQLLDAETWASVCIAIGDACTIAGEYDDAVESYQTALEIRPQLPSPRRIADVKRKIGEIYERKGQYDQALKHYDEGIRILGEDVSVEMARIYGDLSLIYARQEEYEKAIESAELGLRIVKGTGYEKEAADCYDAIGLIYLQKGDYDRAIEHYMKALEARKRIGDRLGLAGSYIKLGITYKYKGEYDKALEFYADSLTSSEEIGYIYGIATSHGELGFVQDIKSNYDEAIWHYNKALALFTRLGNKFLVAITHNNLGEAYRGKDEYDQAMEHLDVGLKMYSDLEDKEGLSDVYGVLSEISLCQGNVGQAQEYGQKAIQLAVEIGAKPYEGSAYRTLGKIQAAMENPDEARKYLDQSLDVFRQLGDKGEIVYTLSDIANFEYEAGDTERAREACAEALKMAEELGIRKIVEEMTDLKQKLAKKQVKAS